MPPTVCLHYSTFSTFVIHLGHHSTSSTYLFHGPPPCTYVKLYSMLPYFFCLLHPAVSPWLHIHSPTNTPCCALRVWLYPRWWMVYTQRQIKLCLIERTIIPLLIGSHKRVWILCLLFSLSLPLFHRSLDTPDTETHKPSKTVARATVPAGAGEKCILQGERGEEKGDHFFAWQISLILCLRCGLMCWSDESSSEDGK